MRLVTFEVPTRLGPVGRVGAIAGPYIVDLRAAYGAVLGEMGERRASAIAEARIGESMIEFFRGGEGARAAAAEAVSWARGVGPDDDRRGPAGEKVCHLVDDVRLRAPVPRPTTLRDFTGFRKHMEDFTKQSGSGRELPERTFARPMYFKANPGMVRGPGDPIAWSSLGTRLDFEIEVAVFVGLDAVDLTPDEARSAIAGFTILNDVSLRDTQEAELALPVNPYGLSKSKDAGGYYMGPCVVTAEELSLEHAEMIVRVNNEEWTRGHMSQMSWSFEEMLSYASLDEPLVVGDCIASGAPPGGTGAEIGRSVAPGDIIDCEVEGIGVLSNVVAGAGVPSQALRLWENRVARARGERE